VARTELEGFVLGLFWEMGPCSPYQLRRQMLSSPSTQWSASAGAIYPLVRRLEKARLVRSRARKNGNRARREYELTASGIRALRAWVGPPLADEAVTVAHDPLRSRARFLGALSRADQLAWVAAARAALDEVEQRVRAWNPERGDRDLMTKSGELDVKSRREWVSHVGKTIGRT
jgi:DNA-binding PadR family transcriptional regulator